MRRTIISAIIVSILLSVISTAKDYKELKERRNHFSKTLYNEKNNTFKTVISGNLMHYKDEKGDYLPIETDLVRSSQKEYAFEVIKGVYKAYFKSDITQPYPVKFEKHNGYKFQMQPYALAYMDASGKEQKILYKVETVKPQVENNIIIYPEIFPGVDLKYTYMEKRLKEEIILTEKFRETLPYPSEYGFKDKSAMLVVLTKIDFSGGLEIEEHISQGKTNKIMLAALKDFTSDSRLQFKRNNKIQFMLPLDFAYMQSEDTTSKARQQQDVVPLKRRIRMQEKELNLLTAIRYDQLQEFPAGNVILDPTVETEFEAVEDVWIENTYNKNYYNFLIIAKTGSYPKKRSLVRFDISSLPSNAEIESANFKLYHYYNGKVGSPSWVDRPTHIHRVLTPWSESTATVNYPWIAGISYGSFYSRITEMGDWSEDSYASCNITQTYKWENFDVTTLVDEWHSNTYQNLGMMIYATNEDVASYDVRFRSSEYSNAAYRPQLEITYRREFVKNYYLKDHLGNIRVTIDEDGDVIGYDDYYPFGLQMPGRSMNNALSNNIYKYSGKELDEENGLDWYYFGARYYDPAIARWLSVDPAIINWSTQKIMQHQLFGLSPYVYVRNNPLNRFDPNGYVDWWQVGAGALGVLGGITEAVGGAAIAASTGVTVAGAIGGVALMAHGFTSAGFSIAQIAAGFKDDGTEVSGGILEEVGKQTGGETGQKVGAIADGLVGAGNPLKNLKNAAQILPTSAKEAKAAAGYQKVVVKEVIQAVTTTNSDVQVVNNTQEIVNNEKEEEEKDKKDGSTH